MDLAVRELFYFPPINNSTTISKNLSKLDRKRCNIYANLLLSLEINFNFVVFVIIATKIRARATRHGKSIYSATFLRLAERRYLLLMLVASFSPLKQG
jgi:hypothetical protein